MFRLLASRIPVGPAPTGSFFKANPGIWVKNISPISSSSLIQDHKYHKTQLASSTNLMLAPITPTNVPVRLASSFYNKNEARDIWSALTSVSPQGRQRGRAKGLMRMKNLHRGQRLGFGKNRVAFPGLAKDLTTSRQGLGQKAKIGTIPNETFREYEEKYEEIQKQLGVKRPRGGMLKQTPLERGWTGSSPQGKKFGPPEPRNSEENFGGFDSVLLHQGSILHMTTKGRARLVRTLMCVGNKQGTAGFAFCRNLGGRGPALIQKAIQRAGQALCTVPLYENRTVYHDFFSNMGKSRVIVKQKPPGHGVKGGRLIKSICEMVGIKDLEVTTEGSLRNPVHITKAFFLGLMRQRTHQELANEKGLHLVEFREENDFFPLVVASPESGKVRTEADLEPNEILDFEQVVHDGHIPRIMPPKEPYYKFRPGWEIAERKRKPVKHHYEQRIEMLVRQGNISSHLTKTFPECKPFDSSPKYPPEGWLELKAKLDSRRSRFDV